MIEIKGQVVANTFGTLFVRGTMSIKEKNLHVRLSNCQFCSTVCFYNVHNILNRVFSRSGYLLAWMTFHLIFFSIIVSNSNEKHQKRTQLEVVHRL